MAIHDILEALGICKIWLSKSPCVVHGSLSCLRVKLRIYKSPLKWSTGQFPKKNIIRTFFTTYQSIYY